MANRTTTGTTDSKLSSQEQRAVMGLGTALALAIVIGAYVFYRLAPADSSAADAILWACAGGFMGGAARSLFMFIWEVGGHASEDPSVYLNKWSLYLLKPLMGIAGGLFFFLAINLGLVGFFSSAGPELDYLRVLLTSVTGGIFFENIFGLLGRIVVRPG